jgi:hypothetical protein
VFPLLQKRIHQVHRKKPRAKDNYYLPTNLVLVNALSSRGLGGCGKSALAIEFAYRALAERASRLVFWVLAISRESFELAYREIRVRLGIPGILDDNADFKQLVKDVLYLSSTREWLMIVDNADDPEALKSSASKNTRTARLVDYLPNNSGGKILFA